MTNTVDTFTCEHHKREQKDCAACQLERTEWTARHIEANRRHLAPNDPIPTLEAKTS